MAILSICSQEELVDTESEGEGRSDEEVSAEVSARRQQIKNKILAVGRMQKVFQLLRCVVYYLRITCTDSLAYSEEAENATELMPDENAAGPSRTGPHDALNVQVNKINRSIRTFADAYVFYVYPCHC